jgi:hypothetical protein
LKKDDDASIHLITALNEDSFLVPSAATWEYSALSYTGAITGILKSLGNEADVADVAGYTGQAFLVSTGHQRISATAVDYQPALSEFSNGIRNAFGWNVQLFWHDVLCKNCKFSGGYIYADSQTSSDLKTAKRYFQRIKDLLKEIKKPMAIMGMLIPEYFIVNGYEGEDYIVSTSRSLSEETETPVNYCHIYAPQGFSEIVFKGEVDALESNKRDLDAIERALGMAGGIYSDSAHITGVSAFDMWSRHLENGSTDKRVLEGNSYLASITAEALTLAFLFLDRMTNRYQETPQGIHLARASMEFKQAAHPMKRWLDILPMGQGPESPLDDC